MANMIQALLSTPGGRRYTMSPASNGASPEYNTGCIGEAYGFISGSLGSLSPTDYKSANITYFYYEDVYQSDAETNSCIPPITTTIYLAMNGTSGVPADFFSKIVFANGYILYASAATISGSVPTNLWTWTVSSFNSPDFTQPFEIHY